MEIGVALDHVRSNARAVMLTARSDGRPAMSPVTVAVLDDHVVVSSRQTAYKVGHLRRNSHTSFCVVPDEWFGRWIQIDCRATVVDLPDAMDLLVDYYRTLRGEHPDWDDYRRAMVDDQRCIIRCEVLTAGPDVSG